MAPTGELSQHESIFEVDTLDEANEFVSDCKNRNNPEVKRAVEIITKMMQEDTKGTEAR